MPKIVIVSAVLAVFLVLQLAGRANSTGDQECRYEIVESMPDGLNLTNPNEHFQTAATHLSLIKMIDNSKETLKIASFYWFQTAEDKFKANSATQPGKLVQDAVARAVARGVKFELVLDESTRKSMNNDQDVEALKKLGTVYRLNMTRLLKAGVLHSKFLIADTETLYVGSSNFDWRSYSEIKEIGIAFYSCSPLAQDLDKIFRTYQLMSSSQEIPDPLPAYLKTSINLDHPMSLRMDNQSVSVFLTGSPPAFNGNQHDWTGRTDDIDALLHVIDSARHRIGISVMNYSPRVSFGWPRKYWPLIDDALRRAATERNVKVQLLFSDWSHTKPTDLVWYKSLDALHSRLFHGEGIHVRMFKVPAFDDFQRSLPFSRVKHDKYMVTDNALFIGTSNWEPDYFINTCGVSVVIRPDHSSANISREPLSVIKNMQDLFDRDFQSEYAHDL